MNEETYTIRKEKKYEDIVNELDDVLVKYKLTFVECYGILELLRTQLLEAQYQEEFKND